MYRHNYNPPSKFNVRESTSKTEMGSSFYSGYGVGGSGALSSSRSLLSGYKRSDPRYSSSDRLLSLYRTSALPSISSSSRMGTASSYRYPSGGLIRRSTSYSSGLGSLLAESGRVSERPPGLVGRRSGVGDRDDTSRSYRSRTPPNLMSQLSPPIAQHQRESKSLGRDEGGLATGAEEDNVERTFEKLYKKYVLDSGVNCLDLPAQAPSPKNNASTEVDAVEEGSHEKRTEGESSNEGLNCLTAESPPVQPAPVVEARQIKPPASQIERSLRLMDFDSEKFKAELKRTLERGSLQLQGDTSKYRALSASPVRGAAMGSKEETVGGKNNDGSTTGNQLNPSSVKQKSKSESPAPRLPPVCRNAATPVEDTTKSGSPNRTEAAEHEEVNSGSNTRSRSRSKSRDPGQEDSIVEENNSATWKRTQRMERTLENLVEKLGSVRKERDNLAGGTDSKDGHRLKPPLLLVTQPSIPNTPITTAAEVVWSKEKGEMAGDNVDVDSGEEEEDADYSDEDEEYTDEEGDFDSDSDMDSSSVCKTLSLSQLSNGENDQTGNLCPKKGRMRSVTPDFEFELPFLQGDESRNDSRGRCSSADALPPPIFVASVSWDGDGADSWDSANEDSPGDEDEADMLDVDDVDVGCTLTLVERAALRGSDDEDYSSSEYWSSTGEDESSDETTSSPHSDECLTVDEEGGESGGSPGASSRSRTASSAILVDSERAQEVEIARTTSLSPPPCESAHEDGLRGLERETKSLSPPQVVTVAEIVAQTPVDSLVGDEVEIEVEELSVEEEEPPGEVIPTVSDVDHLAESMKKIDRTETYAKPQSAIEKVEKVDHWAQQQKPRTDFAKKAVIQPMKPEKIEVAAPPQPQVKVEEKPVEKKMVTSSQEKMSSADRPVAAPMAPKVVPPVSKAPEDKSSMRKSTLNMADDEARRQLEQEQKERLQQRTRGKSAVSAMMEKFKAVEPIKQEPITYKRSSMLEPKIDESRAKKVYQPIVKPAANDEFEKQMAELRKQMKTKSTTLQAQYSTVRHGILAQADDAKLKAMKEKHASKLGTASTIFSRADDEKKRWKELHEPEKPEKKHHETLEKSAVKAKKLEQDNLKQTVPIQEPRRTVRHLKKSEAQAEQPQTVPTTADRPGAGKTRLPPEGNMLGSGIQERKESDSSSTAVSVDKRLKRQYGSRRKTDELMNYADSTPVSEPSTLPTVLEVQQSKEIGDADASRSRKVGVSPPFNADCIVSWVGKGWLGYQRQYLKRKHQRRHPNRRSHFTREPFDVDSLLGLSPFDTFEKMDAFFLKSGAEAAGSNAGQTEMKRMRLTEHQKIWISELKDIDKLYKASELRDIRLTAEA